MPWISTAINVGGNLLGGALGSSSAKKAARRQAAATQAAIGEQRRALGETVADYAPYTGAGRTAIERMLALAGNETAIDPESDPGYQFGLRSGMDALQNSAAAQGGLYSGAAGKALTRYANDYATQKYNDAFNRQRAQQGDIWNRWQTLGGMGQNALGAVTNVRSSTAANTSNLLSGQGNAAAAAQLAQGNIWGNVLNSSASALGDYFKPRPPDAGGIIGGSGLRFAEGGPVRDERSTLQQLLNSIGIRTRSRQPAPAEAPPVEPAPPPAASGGLRMLRERTIEDAERRALGRRSGGPVHGPGGPRDDAIEARLSDGEHVVDAASVDALGDGDNERGQEMLNLLRALLRQQGG